MRSKYHFLPTKKIKEILDHPNLQGIDGKDFGPYKEELEQILWERQSKEEVDTDEYFDDSHYYDDYDDDDESDYEDETAYQYRLVREGNLK